MSMVGADLVGIAAERAEFDLRDVVSSQISPTSSSMMSSTVTMPIVPAVVVRDDGERRSSAG